jgi:hypothetical protein
MRVVGVVKPAHLAAIERLGFTPHAAVDAILAEAHKRNPRETVLFLKADAHDGFNLVAVHVGGAANL